MDTARISTSDTECESKYIAMPRISNQITATAGGPVRCASRLSTASWPASLEKFTNREIDFLTDRVQMLIDSFPRDYVTVSSILVD